MSSDVRERVDAVLGNIRGLLASQNLLKSAGETVTDYTVVVARQMAVQRECQRIHPTCPGACEDGKLRITWEEQEAAVPCHLLSESCVYGARLRAEAEARGVAWVTSLPGLPKRFHSDLAKPSKRYPAMSFAERWVPSIKPFLGFWGNTGTGKSFSCAWALRELSVTHALETWKNPQMHISMKASWMSSYIMAVSDERWREAQSAPILVIDDLGEELNTAAQRRRVRYVLDNRFENNAPTIFSVGREIGLVQSLYGQSTYSRVNYATQLFYCGEDPLDAGRKV